MKKKFGLVIQGPLMSIGKSGEQYFLTLDELNAQGGVVHYDCRENIKRLIDEFGYLFDEIVISTLDNDLKSGEIFHGSKLIAAPDPGGIKRPNKRHYKDNNKFKQYGSLLYGLNELERRGVYYAVKIRVDTYLDLKKLKDSFLLGLEGNKNPQAIYAAVLDGPTYLLHDLYFAADLQVLKKFCESILDFDKFEFISSAHMEAVLKHAYGVYKEEIGVPAWAYFPRSPLVGISRQTKKIFGYMLKEVYFELDPDIFREMTWRGTPFPRKHVSELIDKQVPKRSGYYVPALFSTDWSRYFEFLMQTTGRRLNILDKAIIKISGFGWRVWHLIRRLLKLK